jgi:hypothetical protein
MKGWKRVTNRGQSGARKKQTAAGDHSTRKAKQKHGAEAKKTSLGFAGNNIQGLTNRPGRDNINGPMKGD